MDHKKEIRTIINLAIPGRIVNITLTTNAAITQGKEQYPIKQMHCIKESVPPNREEFIVIIIEPIQIIIKTEENTIPDVFLEVKHRILKN